MIYELRVYRVVQGRMADLLTRFEHHTVPIPSVNRQRRTAL
jgi:hypothetical protein